jgi:hypothetical protein
MSFNVSKHWCNIFTGLYYNMYSGFQNSNLRNYFFKLTFSRTSYQIPGHFQDFPGPCSDSRTFQGLENSLTKFQDFPWLSRMRTNPDNSNHQQAFWCDCILQTRVPNMYESDYLTPLNYLMISLLCGWLHFSHQSTNSHNFTTPFFSNRWAMLTGAVCNGFELKTMVLHHLPMIVSKKLIVLAYSRFL